MINLLIAANIFLAIVIITVGFRYQLLLKKEKGIKIDRDKAKDAFDAIKIDASSEMERTLENEKETHQQQIHALDKEIAKYSKVDQ